MNVHKLKRQPNGRLRSKRCKPRILPAMTTAGVFAMAAQGKSVTDIANYYGISKITFMRRKRDDRNLDLSYEKGRKKYGQSIGLIPMRKGVGQLMLIKPPAVDEHITIMRKERPQELIYRYLLEKSVATWDALSAELKIKDDLLGDSLAEMMDLGCIKHIGSRTYRLQRVA